MKYNITYVYSQGVITFTVEASDALGVVEAAHKVLDPMSIDQLGPFVSVELEEA